MRNSLSMVTLTGAGNNIDPNDLLKISKLYPFVEWGILVKSEDFTAGNRFPNAQWVRELLVTVQKKVNLSLHICPPLLDNIVYDSNFTWHIPLNYKRIQLNFHGQLVDPQFYPNILNFCQNKHFRTIVQLDDVNNDILTFLLKNGVNATGLFDTSHGAGIRPTTWPQNDFQTDSIGFAGGLGPETIVDDLEAIYGVFKTGKQKTFWIDMETNLFNHNGRFDLNICQNVLQKVTDMLSLYT